jgi:hypothetical protein
VRYVVEFELHSDFGNRLGEAIREAIVVLPAKTGLLS